MKQGKGGWAHWLAILLGIVAGILAVVVGAEYLGYVTAASVDGITVAAGEFYTALAIVGAVGFEIADHEL